MRTNETIAHQRIRDAFELLAWIHLSRRRYDEALEISERAMTLGPNDAAGFAVGANVALFYNRPHDMIVLLNKVMRLAQCTQPGSQATWPGRIF